MTRETTLRVAPPPLEETLVKLQADIRPSEERGVRNFIGRNYIGGNIFREPTDVSLLRILARDLVTSGVCSTSSISAEDSPYTVEVTVVHLGGSYGAGVETMLVPVLPTSGIVGACSIKLKLVDRVGRRFLEEVFSAEETSHGALIAGLEGDAAMTLAVAIRRAIDQALPRIRSSVDEFWRKIEGKNPGSNAR